MLHAFLFTQSGIPVLYEGDEVGQLNDYTYHDDPDKKEDSRYLHRGKLDWNIVEQRHDLSTPQARIYQGILSLEKIRKKHDLFEADADTWIVETYNDHILGIGRYARGEKLIALFNFSEYEQVAWINEEEDYIDLLTEEEVIARGVKVPGHDFLWLYHSYREDNK